MSAEQQLGSHWRDFHRFYFHKPVGKIQVSLKPDTNNGHSTRRPMYSDGAIRRDYVLNEKFIRQKL
jgi:hypothetical protein